MRTVSNFIRRAAIGYEPVVAAQIVAAFFTLCSGLGIAVGDLPEKVNAALVFVGVVAPLIAGAYSRSRVTPYFDLTAVEGDEIADQDPDVDEPYEGRRKAEG